MRRGMVWAALALGAGSLAIEWDAGACTSCSGGGNSACLQNASTGRVLTNPHVYVTFWGFDATNDASSEISTENDHLNYLGGSKFLNVVTQYPNGAGTAAGNPAGLYLKNNSTSGDLWYDTASSPACRYATAGECGGCATTVYCGGSCATLSTWNTNNEAEVQAAAHHFGQTGNTNAVYLVFYPPGTNMPCNGLCAFHAWTTTNSDGYSYPYAIIPYHASTSCTLTEDVFHEIGEAITDPYGDGWKISSTSTSYPCQELGDIGQGLGISLANEPMSPTASYAHRGFWSQAANTIAGTSTSTGNVYARATRYDQYINNGGSLYHAFGTANGFSASGGSWSAVPDPGHTTPTISASWNVGAASSSFNGVDLFAWADATHLWHIYWDGSQWNWGDGNNQTSWTTQTAGFPRGAVRTRVPQT